jgi:hypothetical protein
MSKRLALRAVTLAAAVAAGTAGLAAPSYASDAPPPPPRPIMGCVADFLTMSSPGLGGTVTIDPDLVVTVDPNPALGVANAVTGATVRLVECVV